MLDMKRDKSSNGLLSSLNIFVSRRHLKKVRVSRNSSRAVT